MNAFGRQSFWHKIFSQDWNNNLWYAWCLSIVYSVDGDITWSQNHISSFTSLISRTYLYQKREKFSPKFYQWSFSPVQTKETVGARHGESQCFPKFIISWTINLLRLSPEMMKATAPTDRNAFFRFELSE